VPLFERQYLTGSFYFFRRFSLYLAQPLSFTFGGRGLLDVTKDRRNIMKLFSFASTVFLLISLTIGTTVTKANANNYVGEYCWDFSTTLGTIGVIKLGVSDLGDGHYICSGTISVSSPIVIVRPASGNAEFVGDEILVTLNFAGIRNDKIGTELFNITLDSKTISGDLEGIGVYFDAVELFEGTVDYTTCP
jgi:hypothetical protein